MGMEVLPESGEIGMAVQNKAREELDGACSLWSKMVERTIKSLEQ